MSWKCQVRIIAAVVFAVSVVVAVIAGVRGAETFGGIGDSPPCTETWNCSKREAASWHTVSMTVLGIAVCTGLAAVVLFVRSLPSASRHARMRRPWIATSVAVLLVLAMAYPLIIVAIVALLSAGVVAFVAAVVGALLVLAVVPVLVWCYWAANPREALVTALVGTAGTACAATAVAVLLDMIPWGPLVGHSEMIMIVIVSLVIIAGVAVTHHRAMTRPGRGNTAGSAGTVRSRAERCW